MAATFLPAPRHNYQVHVDEPAPSSLLAVTPKKNVPPYGQRQKFVPRAQEDYGDGGAFPEIHVAQFPLEMGRPVVKKAAAASKDAGGSGGGGVGAISGLGNNAGSTAIVAVDVDENGKVPCCVFSRFYFVLVAWSFHVFFFVLARCVMFECIISYQFVSTRQQSTTVVVRLDVELSLLVSLLVLAILLCTVVAVALYCYSYYWYELLHYTPQLFPRCRKKGIWCPLI